MNEIERYYEIAAVIYQICRTLFTAYCLVFWVKPFLRERKKIWRVGAAYAAASFFFSCSAAYSSSGKRCEQTFTSRMPSTVERTVATMDAGKKDAGATDP